MKQIYLTRQGLAETQAELDYLIKSRRPEIAEALKDVSIARSPTDDVEYERLKDEQAFMESRIAKLKNLINVATIVQGVKTDTVSVGTKIELKFLDNNRTETFAIVGATEVDPFNNRLSNESPLAQAILGKKVNDVAVVAGRINRFQVKILGIST